jgi:nitrogen fixation/metabolism regulation signal transduction histidine kinase
MKYVLIGSIVLGAILLGLLAAVSTNTALFSQYYPLLIGLNSAMAVGLILLLVYQLAVLAGQRRRKVFGSLLTFRVLVMFAIVAVLPGALVYTVSVQFLGKSIESWFDVRVDRALEGGLKLGSAMLDTMLSDVKVKAALMSADLAEIPPQHHPAILQRMRDQVGADEVVLITAEGKLITSVGDRNSGKKPQPPAPMLLAQARKNMLYAAIEAGESGLSMRVILPVVSVSGEVPKLFLQLTQPVPPHLIEAGENVRTAFNAYRELSLSRDALTDIYLLALTLVLLLALLSAIALAFLLSRRLARPLEVLAESTQAVASGDFSRRAPVTSQDEMGLLTHSFNSMTEQLDDARKAAEIHRSELELANAHLSSVLANLSAGVMVFDGDFILRIANPSASGILRTDTAALLGRECAHWEGLIDFGAAIHEEFARHGQSGWQREFALDMHTAVLLIRGSVLPAGGGYIVVFDEITQLIAAQRATAWAEVARRVAHEIKNPLTPIQLSAERLEAKLTPRLAPEDAQILARSTQTIVTQVAALKSMVDEFREYARLPNPKLEAVDLNMLVGDVLALYEQTTTHIEARLDADLPAVMGDRNQLRQVIHNLLQNAQDALVGSDNPSIVVSTARSMDEAVLCIADNGSGIPEAIRKRVFEPYVTSKAKGTGLGMAIVKKIIEEHSGRIVIEGNTPRGTLVRINLPFGQPL